MPRSLTTPSGGNTTFTTVYRHIEERIGVAIQGSYSHVTLSLCVRLEILLFGNTRKPEL